MTQNLERAFIPACSDQPNRNTWRTMVADPGRHPTTELARPEPLLVPTPASTRSPGSRLSTAQFKTEP